MPERSNKCRHWPWVLLAIGLILAVGRVAWRWRPLTETEKSLVGTWRHESAVETLETTYGSDRRFTTVLMDRSQWPVPSLSCFEGSWHAAEGRLVQSVDKGVPRTLKQFTALAKSKLMNQGSPPRLIRVREDVLFVADDESEGGTYYVRVDGNGLAR